MSKRANFAFGALLVGLCLVIASGATAGQRHVQGVPDWGNPGGCYYGANAKCWVYSHTADQGRTSCLVVDVGYDPGHTGPFGLKRSNGAEIANIAVGEGYQWAGGCYDDNDKDAKPNVFPRETKSTLGEGPDCSGLVWRAWRESNYYKPGDNSFYFWQRSTLRPRPVRHEGLQVRDLRLRRAPRQVREVGRDHDGRACERHAHRARGDSYRRRQRSRLGGAWRGLRHQRVGRELPVAERSSAACAGWHGDEPARPGGQQRGANRVPLRACGRAARSAACRRFECATTTRRRLEPAPGAAGPSGLRQDAPNDES